MCNIVGKRETIIEKTYCDICGKYKIKFKEMREWRGPDCGPHYQVMIDRRMLNGGKEIGICYEKYYVCSICLKNKNWRQKLKKKLAE